MTAGKIFIRLASGDVKNVFWFSHILEFYTIVKIIMENYRGGWLLQLTYTSFGAKTSVCHGSAMVFSNHLIFSISTNILLWTELNW